MTVTHIDIGGTVCTITDVMTEKEKQEAMAKAKKILLQKQKAQQDQQIVKK